METIFFPGSAGQRCEAKYLIIQSPFERNYIFPSTALIFVEQEKNPGSSFCTNNATPTLLVSRVLTEVLPGCALELINIYYAAYPEEGGHRDIAGWKIVWPIPSKLGLHMYPSIDGIPFVIEHEGLPQEKQTIIRSILHDWRKIK